MSKNRGTCWFSAEYFIFNPHKRKDNFHLTLIAFCVSLEGFPLPVPRTIARKHL